MSALPLALLRPSCTQFPRLWLAEHSPAVTAGLGQGRRSRLGLSGRQQETEWHPSPWGPGEEGQGGTPRGHHTLCSADPAAFPPNCPQTQDPMSTAPPPPLPRPGPPWVQPGPCSASDLSPPCLTAPQWAVPHAWDEAPSASLWPQALTAEPTPPTSSPTGLCTAVLGWGHWPAPGAQLRGHRL